MEHNQVQLCICSNNYINREKQLMCTVKSIKRCPPKITCQAAEGRGGVRSLRPPRRAATVFC